MDRLDYNAIDFAVLNFWPTEDRSQAASDIREAFQHCEPGETFDRVPIRCWKKTASIDLASTGGHEAQFLSRRVFPVRFILRHYPVRSQAHGVRKVFEERKPRFSDEERRQEVRFDLQIHHRAFENLNSQAEAARRDVAHLSGQLM